MSENFLQYTNLTYDDLLASVRSKLLSDPRFENFRESQISSVMIEIFAAFTDFNNYYIERQAEEKFFDSARLKSSAILLSRILGYVVSRPSPAETSISMEIVGPLPSGLVAGNQLTLNRKTSFSVDGTPFVLKYSYTYTFTSSDIVNGVNNSNFSKVINYGLNSDASNYSLIVSASSVSASSVVDIVLMQGEIKSETILGVDTDQIGTKFQKYKIFDTSMSNIYSENDLGYNNDTDTHDQSQNFTRVAIDTFDVFAAETSGSRNYDSFYNVDKRTLLRPDSPLTNTFTSAVPICLLRTCPDGNFEIIFGDDVFSKIGLRNTSSNIYIQYFSTLGKSANQIGVIGQELQTDQQFLVNSIDISNNLKFKLRKNILGGTDLEDIDSIKFNAPGIFSSLDRCVTKKDYISFLKTITSPIDIKNAIAWGEQEESNGTSGTPIKKMFNVVLFSALGELYDVYSDIHQVKMVRGSSENNALSAAVLDDLYSPYDVPSSSYLNIIVKESIIDELNRVSNLSSTSKIKMVLNKLSNKTEITVKNVYITPFINEFDLIGTVYVKKLSNINYIQKSVNNKIYEYLNINADFDTPIYLSNIAEIIESNSNVVYTDISFLPYDTSGVKFNFTYDEIITVVDDDISSWIPVGSETIEAIEEIYGNRINEYLYTRTSFSYYETKEIFQDLSYKYISETWSDNITERNFYNELCKNIYDDLKTLAGVGVTNSFADSVNFNNTVIKMRNSFDYFIKFGMLDTNGNIVKYSMNNQIAKIRIQLTYVYK